jgi:hypothetical protein
MSQSTPAPAGDVAVVTVLDELVDLVRSRPEDLYVRWTSDPDRDVGEFTSTDELTGVPLPGLSANALAIEPWWEDRDPRVWVARRLYDYHHLPRLRGPRTEAWIMTGKEVGRGPDNEPLITDCRVVARLDADVVAEATEVIDRLSGDSGTWGTLDRTAADI